jgi:hypothetical protein
LRRLGVFERYVDEIYHVVGTEKLDDPAVLQAALVNPVSMPISRESRTPTSRRSYSTTPAVARAALRVAHLLCRRRDLSLRTGCAMSRK